MIVTLEDSSYVSDGEYSEANWIRLEAQDENNIRIYTYNNTDTIDLALTQSSAADSQVVWFDGGHVVSAAPMFADDVFIPDTIAFGLNAFIAPDDFIDGWSGNIGVTNQIAETAIVTATDQETGNSGSSDGITWIPTTLGAFTVQLEGGVTSIHVNDTVNVEVAAIDEFGNPTSLGLPLNIIVSDNVGAMDYPGSPYLMESAVDLFRSIAVAEHSGFVIKVSDVMTPATNGSSDTIEILPAGIDDAPIVSSISVGEFGSGDIVYSIAEEGNVDITVYNKVGMEVGTLASGVKGPGYYKASLKALNLASDVYFVVMNGPGINKRVKSTLIK
jgi:hypothetical protein